MSTKEMREALREAGVDVPRSNADVEAAYMEHCSGNADPDVPPTNSKGAGGNVYTYIGGGESSPERIDFMGRQRFTRGKATEVTDPVVLAKVKVNPCFVNGEVPDDVIFDMDEKASQKAEEQRKADKETNQAAERANKKHK